MSGRSKRQEAAPEDKEKLSRLSKRHQRESRKRRRLVIIAVVVVGATLAVGAILDIPYINIARRGGEWLGERFSGTTQEQELPDYAFLTPPGASEKLQGRVETAVVLCRDDVPRKTILGLALMTYDVVEETGEVYLIAEDTAVFNLEGQQIALEDVLKEEDGYDLMRTTIANITGADIDYTVLLGFKQASLLLQSLDFPPVMVEEDTVLVNPLNGETNYLFQGHMIEDADRLLFYLLATDEEDGYDYRLDRLETHLPRAFSRLRGEDPSLLEEKLACLRQEGILQPTPGETQEERAYIASMIQAFAALQEERLLCGEVPGVEVLNGCGVPELGKKVAGELGLMGVTVVGSGGNVKTVIDGEEVNDFSYDKSSIIYRSEDRRVKAYAEYLGVILSVTDVVYESGPGAEIVFIAGRDRAG
ncbi:MAG: LytR C-terminal domain-containing protein [Actinomycetota bacterium]|nr:LytR C-terminal domain-containing protein [Actinomycetota bacterium]